MNIRISIVTVALITFCAASIAAEYNWTGTGGDVDWDNPLNWNVNGSSYTWPQEQFGAGQRWVNDDCEVIIIATGQIVDRFGEIAMSGASASSNETDMTVKNTSRLNCRGDMWIGQNNDGTVKVVIKDESLLTVDGIFIVGDTDKSTGLLEVINSTVYTTNNMYVGKAHDSTGKMEIKRDAPGDDCDLVVEKNLTIGNSDDSMGTLELNKAMITVAGHLSAGEMGNAVGTIEIKGSDITVGGEMRAGSNDNAEGIIEIKDSTVDVSQKVLIGKKGSSIGTLDIKNSIINAHDHFSVGHNEDSTGIADIKDSVLDVSGDLYILNKHGNSVGTMYIKGDSVITVKGIFAMNNEGGANSELMMEGGSVFTGGGSFINRSGSVGSFASFTLNRGTWHSGGQIQVGCTFEGDAYLTVNRGELQANGPIIVGNPSGEDSGVSRIFLNGGLLKGEGLDFNMSADSRIVYKGGELWVAGADLEYFITEGKIDVSSAPHYEVTLIDGYSVLRPI